MIFGFCKPIAPKLSENFAEKIKRSGLFWSTYVQQGVDRDGYYLTMSRPCLLRDLGPLKYGTQIDRCILRVWGYDVARDEYIFEAHLFHGNKVYYTRVE